METEGYEVVLWEQWWLNAAEEVVTCSGVW